MLNFIQSVYAQDIGTIGVDLPDINTIISGIVSLALAAGGLLFFAMLILGGFRYISSGGDQKAAQEARRTLTNAGVGLIIIVAAFLIAQLLFALFGLEGFITVGGGGNGENGE